MNMDWRLYIISVLTCIAIKITMASTEQTKRDAPIEDPSNLNQDIDEVYGVIPDDDETGFDKRRSLMRFGKRRSLMRFGKRGTILRFGKRPSIMRFGKRAFEDDDDDSASDFTPEGFYNYNDVMGSSEGFPSSKRGSIMRFGKRPSLMRFGRSDSEVEKKPHVPWRFGKDLGDILSKYNKY